MEKELSKFIGDSLRLCLDYFKDFDYYEFEFGEMKVKTNIETLTSVHIGSGVKYPARIEFISVRDDDEYLGGIIDTDKVFDIIGEKNLPAWITVLDHC